MKFIPTTIQARIVAVTAVLVLIMSIVSLVMNRDSAPSIVGAVFGIIVASVYLAVLVFDQECVVVGGCNVWGWIRMLLTEVWLLMFIVVTIMTLFFKKKETEDASTKSKKRR